ncbi:hypothetical protein RRG08_048025 [Elysia crispata]|uniref:Uncharacterized protein n=1 Tax=Elysia crispata TaxID=231223 RepID=A0AAE1CKY5_9GAST|nr:hypothetical protein RRG08_048025 [Elysia crispata]
MRGSSRCRKDSTEVWCGWLRGELSASGTGCFSRAWFEPAWCGWIRLGSRPEGLFCLFLGHGSSQPGVGGLG